MTYKDEIIRSMDMLARNDKVVFLGQVINYWDCIYGTMSQIPLEKKVELPIMEDTQMGMSIGLSLLGYIPVSVYIRMDFLILAMNQFVNHLDILEDMSDGEFKAKVIVRAIIGSSSPLNPGLQHCRDHTKLIEASLTHTEVVKIVNTCDVYPAYERALNSDRSTILIEAREWYGKE